MSNRLLARDFGLELKEVVGSPDTSLGKIAAAGIPILSLKSVRAYQDRMLRKYNKPFVDGSLVVLLFASIISLLTFAVCVLGVIVFKWELELAAGSFFAFVATSASVFMVNKVASDYFNFIPGTRWNRFSTHQMKTMPEEIREREKTIRKLFPEARLHVEALGFDPFIFVNINTEETICFGVWDEREGEIYFV